MSILTKALGSGALVMALVYPAAADEIRSGLDDQTAVAITIYNENLALVRDQRRVTLKPGRSALALRDVSARIRPETAILSGASGSTELNLIEQNFDFDLLTPDTLLNKYVGQQVQAVTVNPANGNETIESATVLATNQGVVLQFDNRIETRFPGRLIFNEVPDNLRDRPTLVMELDNNNPAPQEIELSYLTAGLGWRADYVASLSQDETTLDLNAWVTLTNQSGTTYRNALLQLVAGDVQQVQQVLPRMRSMDMVESATLARGVAEESLFEYHLYTLQRPTTVADNQTKQVSLLSAATVPVEKQYVLNGAEQFYGGRSAAGVDQDVSVFLNLSNDESSNLGLPLPGGIVRVYKNDSAGRVQFIGEDQIDHTPKNEDVELKLGNAFDVTAKRVQTSFKKVPNVGQYNFSAEIGHKIILRNAKDLSVVVTVRETIPGDWQILAENNPHTKLSAGTVEWSVEVPAQSSTEFEYITLVRY